MIALRKTKTVIIVFSIFFSMCSFFYVYNFTSDVKYTYMWILPLCFAILSPFFVRGLLRVPFALFGVVFYLINLVRYVVLPFLNTWKKYYSFRSPVPPSKDALVTAEFLMVYELLAICLFLNLRKTDLPENIDVQYQPNESSRRDFYNIFIILCLIIYIAVPGVKSNINIFFAKEGNGDVQPAILLLILMVILAKNLLFVLSLQKLREKNVRGLLLYLALIVLLIINCSVYYGNNRSDFLLSSIACIYITGKVFPKQLKKISLVLIVCFFMIFNSINISRNIYKISNDPTIKFIDMCQGYCGSLYNVGIAVEAAQSDKGHRNALGLINDFLRPTLGTNMIMKRFNIPLSNEIFNERMYLNSNHVVQIMPMIGEGYFYFGIILCPLLDIMFLGLAIRLIGVLSKGDFEFKYFLTITCTRLGFLVGQNSQIQMNDLSFNLFLFFIVWWINKHSYIKR